jgi:hypothetical protein
LSVSPKRLPKNTHSNKNSKALKNNKSKKENVNKKTSRRKKSTPIASDHLKNKIKINKKEENFLSHFPFFFSFQDRINYENLIKNSAIYVEGNYKVFFFLS